MSKLIVEDRTMESAEDSRDRNVLSAGRLVAHRTFQMCEGNPAMTVRVLAAALGTALAHSGASLEEALAQVGEQREAAVKAIDELASLTTRRADA